MRATRGGVMAAVVVLLVACEGPEPTEPTSSPRLEISGPTTLIVHEMSLFEVTARTPRGGEVLPPPDVTFDSSDRTVATVSASGVVTAHARGRVTIGASWESLRVEAALWVRGRVAITPAYSYRPCYSCAGQRWAFHPDGDAWQLALGDTIHFAADYVDVDGVPIGEVATATWTSSGPSYVSVSSEGDAVALVWPAPSTAVDIVASTPDGVDSTRVRTVDVQAGVPATLQLAHAAVGLGPVTFKYNKGAPVTLSFGESVDVPISSGLFFLDAEGMPTPDPRSDAPPRSFGAMIQGGDRLSIFAEGGGPRAFVSGVWDQPFAVPNDSVRIRLLQGGTSAGVVYVLAPDAPADGLPDLCYFDPPDWWGYHTRPVGDVDFVAQAKYGTQYGPLRIRESPPAGRSVTYVFTESAGHPLSIIAFEDP